MNTRRAAAGMGTANLRLRAEARLQTLSPLSPAEKEMEADADTLLHELRVHQAELEIIKEDLASSEARAERAIAASSVAVWDYDVVTGDVYLSEAWSTFLGGDRQPTLTTIHELTELVPDADRSLVRGAVVDALKDESGAVYKVTHRVKKPDGGLLWVVSEGKVTLRDKDGRALRMLGTNCDITERMHTALAQEKTNRALRLLSECNSVLVHAEEEQKLLDAICHLVVDTGGYFTAWIGFAVNDTDTKVRPVAVSGGARHLLPKIRASWGDADGEQGPTSAAIRTTTLQMKECRKPLRRGRDDPDFALQGSYRATLALPVRCQGHMLGVLTIYSFDAEADAFAPDEIKLLDELANNLAYGIEALRMRATSATAHKELDLHRLNLEALVAERTMKLAAAKKEAEDANNAKSCFLAAASHDLRQPLAALKLYAKVLRDKLDAEDQEMLVNMEGCVASLSDLLSKLLDFSKLEAGVVSPHVADFSLDDMMNKVLAAHGPEAEAKGLRLHCGFFGYAAHTDPVLFQRIVGNLVDNAIHYTHRGGIFIGCRRRAGKRWIEVWDTGVGIPEDKIGEVFKEFKQLGDDARTQGSGLGLTIVARTAALLGLEIRVRSRVGHGSMFAIELPVGRTSRVSPAPRATHEAPGIHIGVVDDNPMVLNALVSAIRFAGHHVVPAANGSELLARLDGWRPDVLVCDYRLAGGETGFDVIKAARQALNEDVPAVIITGDTDPALMRRMAENGITIQYKPVEYEDLQARIEEAMRAHTNAHIEALAP